MPNWCENDLLVQGPYPDMEKFRLTIKDDDAEDGISLMQKLYPMPPDIDPDIVDGDAWYDWCIKHWGSKWPETDLAILENGRGYTRFFYLSAWAPHLQAFDKISKDWPTLRFDLEYSEEGMGFEGKSTWKNGKLVFEQASDVHRTIHIEEFNNDTPEE